MHEILSRNGRNGTKQPRHEGLPSHPAAGGGELPPSSPPQPSGNGHADQPEPIRTTSKRAARRSLEARLRRGKSVLVIRTYHDLRRLARAVADRHFKLVILVGNPGLGKTRLLKAAIGDDALILHGRVTPLQLYIQAYRHRGRLIVLDDVGGLLTDPLGVAVLKDLCQTEPEKEVAWHSSTRVLKDEGVEPKFTTTSPVCIVVNNNNWPALDEKLPALEDRGRLVFFDPPPAEIHRAAAEWFADREILDFIGAHLPFIRGLTLRTYGQAAEDKQAGFPPWQDMLIDRRQAEVLSFIRRLLADETITSGEERVRRFEASGLGKRATYFRWLGKLKQAVAGPGAAG
jgi:hypothetical protein